MLNDIRETPAEDYWADLRRRWTSLLSYRYLGRSTSTLNSGPVDNTMRLRHDMRNPAGGIMAAPLCIASPEGGGLADDVAVPNPVIHSLQILDDARGVKRIEVISEVLKQGRQMGFSRSRLVDADHPGRVVALTEGEGISLGGTPEGFKKMEENRIEVEDSPSMPPLWKVFGVSCRRDGKWTLPELSVEMASPDAALHLGPQHILLETAATELAAVQAGTELLQIQSWHVMFVARGKVGPFRVDGQAIPGSGGRVGVRMVIIDEGHDQRVITSGSAVFYAGGVGLSTRL
jgi:acyl-coenzyme A thioesterase PaaI-like protein